MVRTTLQWAGQQADRDHGDRNPWQDFPVSLLVWLLEVGVFA